MQRHAPYVSSPRHGRVYTAWLGAGEADAQQNAKVVPVWYLQGVTARWRSGGLVCSCLLVWASLWVQLRASGRLLVSGLESGLDHGVMLAGHFPGMLAPRRTSRELCFCQLWLQNSGLFLNLDAQLSVCRHMSPAHGALIKISNCVHLCSLAGLLKRQGPPHPSGPLLSILRNGPLPAKTPSPSNTLTYRFGVRISHSVLKEEECEEMCLMSSLSRILTARNAIPVSLGQLVDAFWD